MKIIKVKSCLRCPYKQWRQRNRLPIPYCILRLSGEITDLDTIPSWCPLEDMEEVGHGR